MLHIFFKSCPDAYNHTSWRLSLATTQSTFISIALNYLLSWESQNEKLECWLILCYNRKWGPLEASSPGWLKGAQQFKPWIVCTVWRLESFYPAAGWSVTLCQLCPYYKMKSDVLFCSALFFYTSYVTFSEAKGNRAISLQTPGVITLFVLPWYFSCQGASFSQLNSELVQ